MLQQRKSLIAVLLLFDLSALAQNDSIMQNRKWYVPTGITAEYAGGFGMVSAGALFTPLKKTELAIIGGYTPVEFGNIWTVNLLFSYSPLQLKLNERLRACLSFIQQ